MKIRSLLRVVGGIVLAALIQSGASLGQRRLSAVDGRPTNSLKHFLKGYLISQSGGPDKTTRITAVSVKAEGGATEEQLVYVSGQRWCGSGGCTLLILEPTQSSFRVLGRVTIVRLPIRLLPSSESGHPDIAVRVQGGGVQIGYESVLSFKGTAYPNNPSIPPSRRVKKNVGRTIIATEDNGILLYEQSSSE